MQEVGLRKGDFNESCVAENAKEPQPPLYGMIGKGNFGRVADMKDPVDVQNEETQEGNIVVVVVPLFSMFWCLRLVPLSAETCSCIQNLHDRSYYK